MSETAEATETKVETPKAKIKGTGDLIFDIAHEIGALSKTKALNLADKLGEDIDTNFFKLGGVLKEIKQQQWFEGYASFAAYVLEKFGFALRKADYLINIYTFLVDKQIPWDKVSKIGWTKLKDLAEYLTPENVDEWVTKAMSLTVIELQAAIKATFGAESTAVEGSTSTTSNVQKLGPFKLHPEQFESCQTALAKAKGELGTDHDNVALAAICSGYLANASGIAVGAAPAETLEGLMARIGPAATVGLIQQSYSAVNLSLDSSTSLPSPTLDLSGTALDAVFASFDKAFPNVDLNVTMKKPEPVAA